MDSKTSAFSLIELIIVVLIIGVLSAIAVPAYTIYIVRSKIADGFAYGKAIKLAVSECHASRGQYCPQAEVNIGESSNYIDNIVYTFDNNANPQTAEIAITFADSVITDSSNKPLVLKFQATKVPAGHNWKYCYSPKTLERYVPPYARTECAGVIQYAVIAANQIVAVGPGSTANLIGSYNTNKAVKCGSVCDIYVYAISTLGTVKVVKISNTSGSESRITDGGHYTRVNYVGKFQIAISSDGNSWGAVTNNSDANLTYGLSYSYSIYYVKPGQVPSNPPAGVSNLPMF